MFHSRFNKLKLTKCSMLKCNSALCLFSFCFLVPLDLCVSQPAFILFYFVWSVFITLSYVDFWFFPIEISCGCFLPFLTVFLPPAALCFCVSFVCAPGGSWQGIDRSHSWVNSAYAPGGSRSVLRRNPNSSCELKQVPSPPSSFASSAFNRLCARFIQPVASFNHSLHLLHCSKHISLRCLTSQMCSDWLTEALPAAC